MKNSRRKRTVKNSSNSNFLIQGSILAITSVIVRIIGIVYRIPLTNMIGRAGIGYYSSAFQIYSILLLLSSYSLPLAVSKMVSAKVALNQYRDAYKIFKLACIYALIVGFIAALITYFGADFFATELLKRPMCAYALKTLAPTVLIVAFMGVLRGYFQGLGTMIPTSLSQLIEQVVNAGASILAAYLLFGYGAMSNVVYEQEDFPAALGAAGGTVGTGVGALFALLFLCFIFYCYKKILNRQLRNDRNSVNESSVDISKVLIATIIPVILSSAVYNISSVIDDAIFGHAMSIINEMTADDISALWGEFSGRYLLIINVPIAIASALSASIIPSLTRAVAEGNRGIIEEKISTAIRFAMLIAIPSAIGLIVLSTPVMQLLFREDIELASQMLMYGAVAVIFFSLSTVTNAILQGLNHMKSPVIHALYSLGIHVIILLILLFVFKAGIHAVVIANICFAILMCFFNNLKIKRILGYRQETIKTFILPIISATIMGAVTFAVYKLIYMLIKVNIIACLVAMIAAIIIYLALLIKLRCIDEVELYNMPKGRIIIRLARKLYLL